MTAKEHTNLLSIFSWVYAGIQGLFVCLYLLLVLIYGGLGAAMAFTSKQSDAVALIMLGVFVLIFGLIAILGIICMISNIRLGKQLRGDTPPTSRTMIVSGILNLVSWVCGGILLMPFGIGLGVYGLWFSQSDVGKAFLEGRVYQPNYAFPPNPQYYPVNQPVQRSEKPGPYTWQ
jgi:hypothetical protein